MRPETLPLVSDFKKEYKFLWQITANSNVQIKSTQYIDSQTIGSIKSSLYKYLNNVGIDGMELYQSVVCNSFFSGYVSQLAERVDLPDDEFEIENIPQGPVDFQMPKRVKIPDITVTYLEDSLETVYNFHKAWFQAIRCGQGVGINSPSLFSATAKYIPFEDTMLATEYIMVRNQAAQTVSGILSSMYAAPSLPIGAKATSIITYPKIYPKKIKRDPANHEGTNIAKVDVTYARIPTLEKKHSSLQMWDGTNWNNTASSVELL